MEYRTVNILLVDDDRVDVLAIKSALADSKISNPVYVASDGLQALEVLRGSHNRERLADPFLILLDLNMPRMNGIEFLKELREDPELKRSIVFVLTTSNDERDRMSAYEYNIAGYVVKSEVGQDFVNLVRLLEDYRIAVQFPERD